MSYLQKVLGNGEYILDDIHNYLRWTGHVEIIKKILNRYTQDERETETICTGLN